MSKSTNIVTILLIFLLVACAPNVIPMPTDTKTATPTRTSTPVRTTPATATFTAWPTLPFPPMPTSVMTPTPQPGWITYTNDFLGYSFHYPAHGTIREQGFSGMGDTEVIPPGFRFDDYFDYVNSVLPKNICVIVRIPGVLIAIEPPGPIGSYVLPCVGLGIGDQYNIEPGNVEFIVNGREYTSIHGNKLYLKSTGAFKSEIYFINLENGFHITIVGGPADGISSDEYLTQWAVGLKLLASLHWNHAPDLTKPGTTCAGKFTRLMPSVEAVVMAVETAGIVYGEADLSLESIATLPRGTIVTVREGPVCTNNGVLWRVENSLIPGGTGWVEEGDWHQYFLEAAVALTLTPIPSTNCASDWTHLKVWEYAVVAEGDPNRVRSGPSLNDPVITQIYPGTIVRIIEGPICTSELVFWRVENATIPGGAGWTAEGNWAEYWLEPYKP